MTQTTFDRMMKDSKWKADFERGYEEFLISEFLCEQMQRSDLTVRELAARAQVSPTTVQNLRTGNAENVKVKTLLSVLRELGYSLQPIAASR
ncbi:XRE family transcriptional regulator [Treponema sp. HNW]|uniref:helix-turn-helix domain-containing protein n=1 Tax=Treponema sp. HNW TaxID=3116654 RepID=UPI003D10B552